MEKIVLGAERPILREHIAYQEGGHTIFGLMVPGAGPVNRVTIVPRGQAFGTYQRPDKDRYNYPEAYLRDGLSERPETARPRRSPMAPRPPGPRATSSRPRTLGPRWGMSERVGLLQLAPREDPSLGGSGGYTAEKSFGEATAEAIDAEDHQ
ncbi:MAG TPA: hypothetical protein VIQ27_16090 [Gemmatimonadales bacterium]